MKENPGKVPDAEANVEIGGTSRSRKKHCPRGASITPPGRYSDCLASFLLPVTVLQGKSCIRRGAKVYNFSLTLGS